MEKILLAIDARKIDKNTLDFACYIARLTRSKLTGIFLENLLLEEVSVINELAAVTATGGFDEANTKAGREREENLSKNVQLFREACRNQGVNCEIIMEPNMPANAIITESRFADLVILDAETSFEKKFEGTPTHFVKEVLAAAECPVVIAPVSFEGVDEIIFAYDGSRSSVFAMKQFNYLFPELDDKRLIVLQINDRSEVPVAEKAKIGDLLKVHYSGIGFQVLQGKADEELFKCLLKRKKSFVVIGAFGRSMLSSLFKRSTAELMMKAVNLPIFITHH